MIKEQEQPDPYDLPISCRICLEDDIRANAIAPCHCSGSNKWVHRSCLDRWRTINEDRAFARCTTCLENYVMLSTNDDTPEERTARKHAYYRLVARDFGGMFLLTQTVIALFAVITYYCDRSQSLLISEFGMQLRPLLFYYLCGLIWSAALVGLGGICTLCCNNNTASCPTYYYFSGTGTASSNCCDGCLVGNCEAGSCPCAGVQCGEAGPFVLVIVAGLALIGIVVSVIAGVVFFQRVIQQHIHVLQKQSLAKDYIVMDLAANPASGGDIAENETFASDQGLKNSPPHLTASDGFSLLLQNENPIMSSPQPNPSAPAYHIVNRSLEEEESLNHRLHRTDADYFQRLDAEMGNVGISLQQMQPSAPHLLTLGQRQELASMGLL